VRILLPGAIALTATGLFLFLSDGAGAASSVSLIVHILGGGVLFVVLLAFVIPHAVRQRKRRPAIRTTGFLLLAGCLAVLATGIWPLLEEVASRRVWARTAHVAAGAFIVAFYWIHRRQGINPLARLRYVRALGFTALLGALLFAADRLDPEGFIAALGRERKAVQWTPTRLPDEKLVSVDEVDDNTACIDCHRVIVEEWERSAHRHASMTNPFYRATIEEMRRKTPLEKTQFCSGCHDPALLFTGEMDEAKLDFDGRAARVGLSCVACHTIDVAPGTHGNGDYLFTPRRTYAWERSGNPTLREAHAVLIRLKPEAHKRSLRPSNVASSTFCATCHKAELSPELNDWHWFRAQDEYDAWHASGVSMGNARSFYHPPAARQCQDCHMPLVSDPADPTADPQGLVRSHLFAAANTGLAHIRGDQAMIERMRAFLRTACRIDVTAWDVTPKGARPEDAAERYVPASASGVRAHPGDLVEAHVVVRTLGVGHRFPGGTIDSNEVWVEFQAAVGDDAPFWVSGAIDPATGVVDQDAEFYRAWLTDQDGQRVVNRLGTDVRTRVYVKTIPPGAADVVRFRFRVPEGARGHLRVKARLRYRKFMRAYVDFVFPGDKTHRFRRPDGSIHISDVTQLPILELCATEVSLPLGDAPAGRPSLEPEVDWPHLYERVNDLGIGYFLQGDHAHAAEAFSLVTQHMPSYADGWVNLARVLLARRKYDETIQAVDEALKREPGYPKALYIQAEVQRARLRFAEAEASYEAVLKTFPEDRVVLERLGQVLWEQEKPKEALVVLRRLLAIDEANPQAWLHVVNCYRQLGDLEGVRRASAKRAYYRPDLDERGRKGKMLLKYDLTTISRPIHVHRAPGLR